MDDFYGGDELADTKYLPLFHSYLDTLSGLTDEQLGKVVRAALRYSADDIVPELEPLEAMAFGFIKRDIDMARDKYEAIAERNHANGMKGGRPRKNPENPVGYLGSQKNPENPEEPKKPNEKEKEKEKEKENIKESVKKESRSAPGRFAPPTPDEVRQYCNEHGYMVDADQFVDFYTQKGWMVGKNRMKDWQAAVRTWVRRRQEDGGYKQTSFVPQPDDYPF